MSAIRTEQLQKVYGDVRALDGLTFSVEPGTVFGFLGPNGAGKTTTIRLLTGLAHPSGGKAWVAGEDITNSRKVAARIGFLPEEPAFYTWMTPLEFLDHVGRLFGLPGHERTARAEDLLEQVGLTSVRKRRIAGFSRGMRQRLALAQALINRPEVLFLDEPVSALDPAGRKEVLEMITRLRGECTVFMSTHILDDAQRVCDTVGIIDHGRLIVEAQQADLRARYGVPAFELECVDGYEEALRSWAEAQAKLPWVDSATCDGGVARILANDVKIAQQSLLARAVEDGLVLKRYEVVTPSLEDVFLRLVGEEGAQA